MCYDYYVTFDLSMGPFDMQKETENGLKRILNCYFKHFRTCIRSVFGYSLTLLSYSAFKLIQIKQTYFLVHS